ncbi:hypothetical protein SLEP1_g58696 [Rubroshorea leprosula]|uniref:Uncharacterized protein n=1 Tax=Rubroshorea leprosula TaxID=152421 RepID=A0AAV5MR63_9ROSI|nr:hypothetical protein SLEP1_g58696 [Rubroshorea leprosula]
MTESPTLSPWLLLVKGALRGVEGKDAGAGGVEGKDAGAGGVKGKDARCDGGVKVKDVADGVVKGKSRGGGGVKGKDIPGGTGEGLGIGLPETLSPKLPCQTPQVD